ncbi:PAS domain-containing sensor histidine kinase [Desertivirga brevis]|uniref:PAS domain-containing sensor histidine kinase n=1 Tax=Desertivirga brevis TaxID=2810310 RepID=UPI001A95B3E3|nr:PAS domain S-box protein [Pedobacter sp. SYSU D00873]
MGENSNTIPEFLKGGGETGDLIRSGDWRHVLPASFFEWPSNLCYSLSLLLNSSTPIFLFWGERNVLFYNDAYIPALQSISMHPFAMGKPGEEVWGDSWKFISPELEATRQGKTKTLPDEAVHRLNTSEDILLTYHLNPIKDDKGAVSGILVICNETISVAAREQLQTQKRLEQLNREMTHLFSSINEGFYSKDIVNQRYLKLSAGCPKIYGYTTEEFFSNPKLWAEVIHPDDKERVFADDAHLNAGRQTLTEYRIFHKSGSLRWIEVKAIPVLTDGILTRVDGIVNDITARKLAENETLKQKLLSESIVNSLPGIFYFFDRSGKFLKWNKNFELVSGFGNEEIAHMQPLDFFSGEDKPLLKAAINEAFEKGESSVEAYFYTRDKKKIPYFFTGRTIIFEGRTCIVGTGLDISNRVAMEETLQKKEAMLSHVLNSIPQAIFWKDLESRYLGCNTVFAAAAGFSTVDEIVGKTDYELPWNKEEADKYRDDDAQVIASGEAKIHFIETQTQSSGDTLWVDTTKLPLTDINGNVYGILGIYEDISERKKDEEERERMTQDLIEKNINLKQFSYIVSHNLRSPINKILGLASLIKMAPFDDEQNTKLIEYIVSEATSLDTVVKDLTTIVSFQDLGVNIKEDIVISEEVGLVKTSLGQEIEEAGTSITCDFAKVNNFKSVKGYFYSILYNLITNAIKYRHPERASKIHISTTFVDNFICLSVSDNGLGIDLEKHGSEIFGLYSRFHSKDIPGKGMGLNLVKTQAETLGGKVEVESTPGEGSTFRIYFLND